MWFQKAQDSEAVGLPMRKMNVFGCQLIIGEYTEVNVNFVDVTGFHFNVFALFQLPTLFRIAIPV